MRCRTLLIAVGAGAVFFLMAIASSPAAAIPDPTPESNALYLHQSSEGGCCRMFMSADPLDPNGGVAGVGYAPQTANYPSWEFEVPLEPTFRSDVHLDREQEIEFIAYVRGGQTTVAAGVLSTAAHGRLLFTLTVAGQEVAHAESEEFTEAAIAEVRATAFPQVDVLPAGSDLIWTIRFEGVSAGSSLIIRSDAENSQQSRIVLPVAQQPGSRAPESHFNQATGPVAEVAHAFDEPTSDTYVYNWTTDLSQVEVHYDVTVENGSATLTVTDGEGKTLIEATLTGTIAEVKEIGTAVPGDWQVRIQYDDFVGSLDLEIRARAQEHPETQEGSGGAGTTGTSTGTGNAAAEGGDGGATNGSTVQEAGDVSENAPGPGILALLAAVGLLAAAMRRRRS